MYLDVIKDRLYTMKSNSLGRQSAQYTVNEILKILLKSISPILPFTAYEFEESINPGEGDSIFYTEFNENISLASKEELEKFELLQTLRSSVYQAIEAERQVGNIKNALDCDLEITLSKQDYALVGDLKSELSKFFISSSCIIKEGEKESIVVQKSGFGKCSRCWHRTEEVKGEEVCSRCETNMSGDGEVRSFF